MQVIVAVDHGCESLTSFVGERLSDHEFSILRRSLASASMRAGADGIVVHPADFDWARSCFEERRVILGYPDLSFDGCGWPASDLAMTGTPLKVKLGFHLSSDLPSKAEIQYLLRFLKESLGGATGWILEPYMNVADDASVLYEFLSLASTINEVEGFKLDISVGRSVYGKYSWVMHGKPWFARSCGAFFQSFVIEFTTAIRSGCCGAIVGAGVWRDVALALAIDSTSDKVVAEIRHRVDSLKQIVERET